MSTDLQSEALDLLARAVGARCEPEIGIYEKEIAAVYAEAMEDYGLEVEVFEEAPDRPSVVGRVPGSGGGKSLGFNAHLMSPISELEDWKTPPYELQVEDGRAYGSGVADAKAGIVAMILAARELAQVGPKGDLIVALGAGGELGGMIGTKAIIERGVGPDALIVCEATHLDLVYRERGAIFLDVNVRGETGLTGGGVNANHAALRVAQALLRINEQIEPGTQDVPADVGPGALNINYIKGGSFYYNVPDRCVLYVDRRLTLGETLDDAMRQIETAIAEAKESNPDANYSIDIKTQLPPCETDPESTLARELGAVIQNVKGAQPALKGIRGFTEMAHWHAAGIDSLVCGPGGVDVIHRPNEYVEVSEFVDTIEIYSQIAKRLTDD